MWPIFIINLDRATARRAASEQLMQDAGLDFQRVAACDWQRLDPADLEAHISPQPARSAKRPLSPAEVACFMSHLEVWREVAAGDSPGAFIFEDDFAFNPDFRDVLTALSAREPDWDILKFYSNKRKTLTDSSPLIGKYSVGTPKVIPMSTIAYAITRPAAARLLAASIPFRRPVDLFIKHWWEHGGCVKLVAPAPVDRRPDHLDDSDIHCMRNALRTANPLFRLYVNTLYQLSFRTMSALHSSRRPRGRIWFEEQISGAERS